MRTLIKRKEVFIAIVLCLLLIVVGPGHSREKTKQLPRSLGKKAVVADSLDKESGLVIAPGFVLVKAMCTGCHSPKLITSKRATRDGWIATIRWMQKNLGLWDLGKAEPEILDYLTTHYAPTDTGRRPMLKNIQWYKL